MPFAALMSRCLPVCWFGACLGVACIVLPAHGVEPVTADPDLPLPLDVNQVLPLLQSPPFTRALNLSESLHLTGVAYVGGKPVATVKDMTTNKSHVVSEEPNSLGWRLAGAAPDARLEHAAVQLMVGNEIVVIRYSESQTTPAKKGYMPAKIPTPEEFTGHDEKGAYVRGMPYLDDKDRERFRSGIPRETREKFLNIVHDHRDMLFKASHEDRAAFVKKVFDSVVGK